MVVLAGIAETDSLCLAAGCPRSHTQRKPGRILPESDRFTVGNSQSEITRPSAEFYINACRRLSHSRYVLFGSSIRMRPERTVNDEGTENKLLIVVQNSTRQVSVYLAIFEVPDHKTWSPGNMEIKISIANIIPVVPYGSSAESGGHVGEGLHQGAKSHLISHLDVIPPTDFQKTAQQPPTILIFLTPSVNAMGVTTADQSWSTVVKRWQITSMERKLHPTFQAMESTAARNQADPTTSLHRLPDVVINDVVTNIHKIEANDQIALSFADGSCALYDSASFKPISSSLDTAEVHNLAQGGYIFPLNLGGLDVAISSNGSVSANVNKAGSMQLTHLEHTSQLVLGSSGESDADTTRVAVILACNRSIYLPTSSNDLLLLIRKQFPSQDHPQLVQSILKGLVEDAIFEPDLKHSNLTAKSAAMRLLGLAACLGQDAATGQRSRASMLSWLILALRSCNTILIAILFSIGKTQGLDWKDDHVCEYAINNIRWALDLCKFVVDEGFDIDDEECHGDLENSELAGRQNRTETQFIAQLLLLSCWSRCMLMGIPWVLRKIAHHISLPQSPLAPEAAPAFARMVSLFQKSPLDVQHLEQFFSNTQSVMKQVHQSSGVSAETWADAERFLLARGQIPEPMQGAMPQILQNALRPYRDKIDRLSLYIHDYAWLGIGQDSKTKAFHRDYIVDVHRKSIVAKKDLGRVRRCVRCGSISTDVVRNRNWPLQVQMVMTRCVCEDSFEIVESEELD